MSQPNLSEPATESLFDDDTHTKLDQLVNVEMERPSADLPVTGDLSRVMARSLLSSIIEKSQDKLIQSLPPSQFIDDNAFAALLNTCWKSGKYSQIRDLKILRPQVETKSISDPKPIQAVESSFKCQYHGTAVDGFHEFLIHHDKAFHDPGTGYYAKFCSIVQSSGTGKSRLMLEMAKKDVLVLYLNLRTAKDTTGYPQRDNVPARILTENLPSTEQEYNQRCCAFFAAIFHVLKQDFDRVDEKSTMGDMIKSWNEKMCRLGSDARDRFFKAAEQRYNEILNPRDGNQQEEQEASEVADSVQKLSLHDKPYSLRKKATTPAEPDLPNMDGAPRMIEAFQKMITRLVELEGSAAKSAKKSADKSALHSPKLLIAIDEAHTLSRLGQYRASDVVCRAISLYSAKAVRWQCPVWVAFASTTSRVADFSAPQSKRNSARVKEGGKLLVPPYTQLGWDHFAEQYHKISPEAVCNPGYIVRFGRPLWASLHNAGEPIGAMVNLADHKLRGAIAIEKENADQLLALLGQRFGLEIAFGHPDSVAYLETAVASHLRVCIDVTLDRTWKFTSYPSEPFLSCVAAEILHSGYLNPALTILLNKVEKGMIDKGKIGELTSRLLWLLAKDLFVRAKAQNGAVDHLGHCTMISVVAFLQYLFGSHAFNKSSLLNKFNGAYVNFTHWVSMDTTISCSELSAEEWTGRHWYRTSAVQCCHHQPLVDKVIPIFFENRPREDCMSQIFIQDKARKGSQSDALEIIERDGVMKCKSTLPYIAILCDLGVNTSECKVKFDQADNSLRIHAKSICPETFDFLNHYSELRTSLQNLVLSPGIPRRPFAENLKEQMRFGRSCTKANMCWEQQDRSASPSNTG